MNKKTIWITGASSGIGKALAIKFAENGWNVAASARRENLLNELKKINQSIYPFPLDVKKINDCELISKIIVSYSICQLKNMENTYKLEVFSISELILLETLSIFSLLIFKIDSISFKHEVLPSNSIVIIFS